MQKNILNLVASTLCATFLLSGCGSDSASDNNEGDISALDVEGKTFLFYNATTGSQYVVDTDHQEIISLDTNASNNFYMLGKDAGELVYWPDESTGDAKVIMLKENFSIAEGNVTHENIHYLGHFHGADLAAHHGGEFAPDVASAAKIATLGRFNTYLQEREEIKEEIQEALSSEGEQLCNFYVEDHHHEGDLDVIQEEEEAVHFALTQSGKVLFYVDGTNGLEKIQGQLAVNLSEASSCEVGKSGITSSEAGVYIFLESTQKLYLVDSHGLDYHEHSAWKLDEFMPSGFHATQMIAFGEGDEEHEH